MGSNSFIGTNRKSIGISTDVLSKPISKFVALTGFFLKRVYSICTINKSHHNRGGFVIVVIQRKTDVQRLARFDTRS